MFTLLHFMISQITSTNKVPHWTGRVGGLLVAAKLVPRDHHLNNSCTQHNKRAQTNPLVWPAAPQLSSIYSEVQFRQAKLSYY